MAFKVYEPKTISFNPLQQGEVSLDKDGTARFLTEDLELVGIETSVIVLTDELTLRIAIRNPRPGESGKAISVTFARKGKTVDRGRAQVRLTGALRQLRLDPEAVKGRYTLMTKDDLLIVSLADCKTSADDDEETDGEEAADKD